jgi:putative MATE family efflux protein
MVIFNLADAYFVGQLGTAELAALSFTFPVVMIIGHLAMGIGIGASAMISRAIGEGNRQKVRRLTTDSLVLSLSITAVFVAIGLFTIDPLFRLIGADGEVLPLINKYMTIWYSGVLFVIVPMVGNNALRAAGDTKTPALIMVAAAVVNIVLDPLLIFGIGPFPRLEITGAAIATVVSRAAALFVAVYVLHHRDRMITYTLKPLRDVVESWRAILYIGVPAAGTRVLIPVGVGILTRLIASYGPGPVAAFGVASRIEFFVLTAVFSLSAVLGPFVGQNRGAGRYDRVRKGVRLSDRFSMVWGLGMFALLALTAGYIAPLFNDDLSVVSATVLYLRIIPISYGLMGILFIASSALNVINRPIHAAVLSVGQMFGLMIPLAALGSFLAGLAGLFAGVSVSFFIAGITARMVLKKAMAADEEEMGRELSRAEVKTRA